MSLFDKKEAQYETSGLNVQTDPLKTAATHNNASTQVNVPPDVARRIFELGQKLIPDEVLAGDGRESELHLTLKYGVREDEFELRDCLTGQQPFTVTLGKVQAFTPSASSDGAAPIVVEANANNLGVLHELIGANIGKFRDDFLYTPHVTIAYVKPEAAKQFADNDSFVGITFSVTSVTLSKMDNSQIHIPLNKTAAQKQPDYTFVEPEIPLPPNMYERTEPVKPEPMTEKEIKNLVDSAAEVVKEPEPELIPTQTPAFKKWFANSKVCDPGGEPLMVYHGTTHEFNAFDPSSAATSNYYGQALYFTDSQLDVNENYATDQGHDIRGRIDALADQIMEEARDEWDDSLGDFEDNSLITWEYCVEKAEKQLLGSHKGVAMPVYLSIQRPVIVQKFGGTEFEINYNENTDVETGTGLKLWEKTKDTAIELGMDGFDIAGKVFTDFSSPFSAWEFEEALRKMEFDEPDTFGILAGKIWQNMGYDGVIFDAYNSHFGLGTNIHGMQMDPDTQHYIIWNPRQVKSAIGNQGTYNRRSPNITAAAYPNTPIEKSGWVLPNGKFEALGSGQNHGKKAKELGYNGYEGAWAEGLIFVYCSVECNLDTTKDYFEVRLLLENIARRLPVRKRILADVAHQKLEWDGREFRRRKEASDKTAAIPQNLKKLDTPVSKEYDAVKYVWQYFARDGIEQMTWQQFQKTFQQFAAKYNQLFTTIRNNKPQITIHDLKTYLDNPSAQQPYEIDYSTYEDPKNTYREVEQLVLRINQGASAKEVLAQDPVIEQYVSMVGQSSQWSKHPVAVDTVGWLRVDFVNDEWLLVDEVQSDLVNSITQAKAIVTSETFEEFLSKLGEKAREAARDKISEQQYAAGKRNFIQAGYSVEKLDEIKAKLIELFKDWAEYAIASLIEIARKHGIQKVAIHTAESIAKRDTSIEAEKVKIYYDHIAQSFGFRKENVDVEGLKGDFWVRTASSNGSQTSVEYEITTVDSLRGELNAKVTAKIDGNPVGFVQFSEQENEIWIKYVWTDPQYRRLGIGTGMYEKIKQDFPGKPLNSGGNTNEGKAFRHSLTERGVLGSKFAAQDSPTSLTVVGEVEGYRPMIWVRWERGMRWREVLKVVKQVVGDVYGRRIPWKNIHIFTTDWKTFDEQQQEWDTQQILGKRIMFDALTDGTWLSVGANYGEPAVGAGGESVINTPKQAALTRHALNMWEAKKQGHDISTQPQWVLNLVAGYEIYPEKAEEAQHITSVLSLKVASDITLPVGTKLYRGIGEDVIHPHSAGFDGCLWVTQSQTIARTYIPTAPGKVYISLSCLCSAPDKRSSTADYQKQLGFEYTDINYKDYTQAQSYTPPVIQQELMKDTPYPDKKDFPDFDSKNYRHPYYEASDKWHKEQDKRFKQWVKDRLKELGYEPNSENSYDSGYILKTKHINGHDTILPNKNVEGTIITFENLEPLKIFDMTEGGKKDGDLMDPDYRKLDTFKKLTEAGYDGVKISDFAQVEGHGNVGHTSIGIFPAAISKVKEVNRELTIHPEDLWGDIKKYGGEKIQGRPKNRWTWVCICGNDDRYAGFINCHEDGDADHDSSWYQQGVKKFCRCNQCWRVINFYTLRVVGIASKDLFDRIHTSSEKIKGSPRKCSTWVCICGNSWQWDQWDKGITGIPQDFLQGKPKYIICMICSRIINWNTLMVVGMAPEDLFGGRSLIGSTQTAAKVEGKPRDPFSIKCVCGNSVRKTNDDASKPFAACGVNGERITGVNIKNWNRRYIRCGECDRIINCRTLKVVGIAPVDLFGNNTIMGSKTAERIKGTKGIPYFAGGDGVTTDWECVCGNACDFLGFFLCDKNGQHETTRDWGKKYGRCNNCGRIINAVTMNVVGYSSLNLFGEDQPIKTSSLKTAVEIIQLRKRDGFLCVCGNGPEDSWMGDKTNLGFRQCDKNGNFTDFTGYRYKYVRCQACGRVIDYNSLRVKAYAPMGLFGDPVRTSSLKTAERGKTVKGYVKCVCGNTFSDAGIDDGNHLGFHWCDKEGIHLTYSSDFIRCRKCGRIMNRKSLQIRGVYPDSLFGMPIKQSSERIKGRPFRGRFTPLGSNWSCICGNYLFWEKCNKDGTLAEYSGVEYTNNRVEYTNNRVEYTNNRLLDSWIPWDELHVYCPQCGRIINSRTLKVVSHTSPGLFGDPVKISSLTKTAEKIKGKPFDKPLYEGSIVFTPTGSYWECICGNNKGYPSFTMCDEDGRSLHGDTWDGKYVLCTECSRVINCRTLKVKGIASKDLFGQHIVTSSKSKESSEKIHGIPINTRTLRVVNQVEKNLFGEDQPIKTSSNPAPPTILTSSHKTPPLSDTTYRNPEQGTEQNAYANIPERVEGTQMVPQLEELAPELFSKRAETDDAKWEALDPKNKNKKDWAAIRSDPRQTSLYKKPHEVELQEFYQKDRPKPKSKPKTDPVAPLDSQQTELDF